MWVKDKSKFPPIADVKIVKRDFIIAEANTGAYTFCGKEGNPFGRGIHVPIFYLFKVHQNHPLRITEDGKGYVHVYPEREIQRRHRRMPAEVHKDRIAYDLSTFLLLPFPFGQDNLQEGYSHLPNGFKTERGEENASVVYIPHGNSMDSGDSVRRVSEVMPSQVQQHLFSWLTYGHRITSYGESLSDSGKLEGRIEIDFQQARKLTIDLIDILEERYKTRLKVRGI